MVIHAVGKLKQGRTIARVTEGLQFQARQSEVSLRLTYEQRFEEVEEGT